MHVEDGRFMRLKAEQMVEGRLVGFVNHLMIR